MGDGAMENGMTTSDMLRMIGFMTICVGVAWAIQILGFSADASGVSHFAWVLAAASVSGAGVGLVVTAGSLPERREAVASA